MNEHIAHIQRCYQLADEAVAGGNHPFGALAGGDFLAACHEVFVRGSRKIEVIGPVLEEEGLAKHLVYWRREPPIAHGGAV